MDYLPLFIDLQDRPCLIVGGGDVAARKAAMLCKAGAIVVVVAPTVSSTTMDLIDNGEVSWLNGVFSPEMLADKVLVIAATDDKAVNNSVYQQATAKNILVNVADAPEMCNFVLPSILDRSPIVVAVSSGGKSPILARQLRTRLETLIPESYSDLGQLVGCYREKVKAKLPTLTMRRRFWDEVLQSSVVDHALAGRRESAEHELQQMLAAATHNNVLRTGEVYLVGAGPGDPDLLTFKALRLMQQADIVFYDRLVSKEVLALARKDAEQVYVGKQRTWHAVRQDEINQLLLTHAQQGKRVLRLKGGDPFIFGRGGEEIATLSAHNIPFQVVPGITAASGCACYAGIPLTHRDYAQSCTFVTGQLSAGDLSLNWQALVQPRQTVVVYMGLAGLAILSRKLCTYGMAGDTPAALVEQGTTVQQKVWASTIFDLPALAKRVRPVAPTLIIIGEVVRLYDSLSWR